ncbi:MAG: hypothetical protein ACYSVY_23390 [Planctomycetota bacterium]|jgi:hypothetical protein
MMNLWARRTAALGIMLAIAGCPKRESAGPPVTTSKPAATSQPAPTSQPGQPQTQPADRPDSVEIRIQTLADNQDGWLRIEAIRSGAHGAWATGSFVPRNKIIIETEDVEQFSIDLSQLRINWNRRVVLRIDGHASELTKKRRPVVHLRRSPAGSWDVVQP